MLSDFKTYTKRNYVICCILDNQEPDLLTRSSGKVFCKKCSRRVRFDQERKHNCDHARICPKCKKEFLLKIKS